MSRLNKLLGAIQEAFRSDPTAALPLLEEAIGLAAQPLKAQLKLWKVRCLVQLGRAPAGLAVADEVIEDGAALPPELHLEALHLKAAISQECGKGDEALRISESATAVARRYGEPLLRADALCRYGELLRNNGQVEKARGIYALALEQVPDDARALRVALLSNLGNALLALGHAERALATFDRAIAIAGDAEGDDDVRHGPGLAGRGNALQELGRLEEARGAYLEAQEEFRARGDLQTAAGIGLNLGHLLSQEGHLRQAREVFEGCLDSFRGPFAAQRKGSAMGGLAELACCSGSNEEASRWYEQARAAYASCGDAQGEAYARLGIGHMQLRRAEREAARATLLGLQQDFAAMDHPPGHVATCELLGELERDREDYDAARAWFEDGIAAARELADPHHLASLLCGVADVELRRGGEGSDERARTFLEEARGLLGDTVIEQLRAHLEILEGRAELSRAPDKALTLLAELGPRLETCGNDYLWLDWAEVESLALIACGQAEEGHALAARARDRAEALGWRSRAGWLAKVVDRAG